MPSEPKYERRDANAKWIFVVVVFLFVAGTGIEFGIGFFMRKLKQEPTPTDLWRPLTKAGSVLATNQSSPALQVSESADLEAFRAREQGELENYGWINRTSGIVRVPIERAMELVLQEGLPTRVATNGDKAGPSTYQMIRERSNHREPEIKGAQ